MIEHLQRQVNILGNALRIIDQDVARAARKYLRSTEPYGYLQMATFIDLLAIEIRREVRAERIQEIRRHVITDEIKAKIESKLLDLMPQFKAKVSDHFIIRVLISQKDKELMPILRKEFHMYRASALRGKVPRGLGRSPEEAYAVFRENLILEISKIDVPCKAADFFKENHPEFRVSYDLATPFRMDEIEGFKVEVRLKK